VKDPQPAGWGIAGGVSGVRLCRLEGKIPNLPVGVFAQSLKLGVFSPWRWWALYCVALC
jgi:hypothetical protein